MGDTQDDFFDSEYWAGAVRSARRDSIVTPLGVAVVYDSRVHGSWPLIRRKVNDGSGTVADVGERAWIRAYVERRHDWLAHHRRTILRATVYRMEAFARLIEQEAWMLETPLVVRQREIDLRSLGATPPHVYEGPEPRSREIVLTSPLQRGLDVRLVQLALSGAGHRLEADGIYGRMTGGIVRSFQRQRGLAVTGAVGVAEFDALGLWGPPPPGPRPRFMPTPTLLRLLLSGPGRARRELEEF